MLPGLAGIAGFTSTAPAGPTDPNFANTILLLSGDGTNGSVTFTDESFANRGTATIGGGGNSLVVSTATKVYGTGSMRGDSGFNDSISFADHADWTLGTSDFTIEFFHYFESNTADQDFVTHYNASTNNRGWVFGYRGTASPDVLRFSASSNGTSVTQILDASFTPTIQTWYYLCVERSGTTFRIYTGTPGGTATVLGSATSSIDIFNAATILRISGQASAVNEFYGNMDELRMTLGVARYNGSSFAVPTAAFPRS